MSSNSVNPIACTLCGAGGHRERACPDLHPPPDGFWKGERMPDDEGEEDCCKKARGNAQKKQSKNVKISILFYRNSFPKKKYICSLISRK